MNAIDHLLWLDKIERDMMDPKHPNPFINLLYKKGSWWRNAHEKAMGGLTDADIVEYNRLLEVHHIDS